ncbi:hypothetical protein KUCAC02_027640 [Chaenocephalus aceratus]|uniref:Uncharacterized protein n=1 Tax=Chaenocephalus aceratus TaxID=36190 RepID=A0ACB9W4G2_CHAAC|nr:hypothetical protein KUCAC02_027640 [Chaenocephalus aceratus]
MIVKVQYRNQKNEREVFHPVDSILSVEDETGTEVDDYAFPDLLTTSGICFVIKDELNDSGGTDTISVTSKSSSENDFYSGTLKRFRKEEEALQGPQAKNLIKPVLLTKPGGSDVLKEYEEKGTISPATRKVWRIPQRLTKEKYALGIVTLFPSLQDPHGKTGYILQDFSLLFGSETPSKLLEKWPTAFKAKVIQQAEMLTSTLLLKRLLLSAKNQGLMNHHWITRYEWDSDMTSILLLLHLLSPQPEGRKKTQKISVAQAIDHLVVFHKDVSSRAGRKKMAAMGRDRGQRLALQSGARCMHHPMGAVSCVQPAPSRSKGGQDWLVSWRGKRSRPAGLLALANPRRGRAS